MSVLQTGADLVRAVLGTHMAPPTAAIIVAAGRSTRMGGISKQFAELCGKPVLAHTLLAFEACRHIDEIVVVIRPEDEARTRELAARYGIRKLGAVVHGGETRMDSVKRGFAAIGKRIRYVAIHDGARCLVTPEMIGSVLREAYRHRAATAASPVTDTVKLINRRGYIERTIDRDRVLLAQTPQVFHVDLYTAALTDTETHTFTDDNQLMEYIRVPVKPVNCGAENLKITTREDLDRAAYILARRAGQ